MSQLINVTVESVKARACENGGPDYYDVRVSATTGERTVRGAVSIEKDGRPAAGAVDVSEWASKELLALSSDELDEVCARAARAIGKEGRW